VSKIARRHLFPWIAASLAAAALAGCGSSQHYTAEQQAAITQARTKLLATGYRLDHVTKIVLPTVRGSDTWHIEGSADSAKFGRACVILNGTRWYTPRVAIKDCQ
jgi:hypothetical protein